MTLCTECKHLQRGDYHEPNDAPDYDYRCRAKGEGELKTNPVNGKQMWALPKLKPEDPQRFEDTPTEALPHCSDLNEGDCSMFERSEKEG